MKASVEWLNEYADIDVSAKRIRRYSYYDWV